MEKLQQLGNQGNRAVAFHLDIKADLSRRKLVPVPQKQRDKTPC